MENPEKVIYKNQILAIIIYSSFSKDGISFFTEDDYSQQLGYMNRKSGYIIPPHRHNVVKREIRLTQEVLFIKSGKLRVDFYNESQIYISSKILNTGDVILLASGGHGFEMLEDTQIIEVKQGPYIGENDKIRFNQIDSQNIKIV